MTKRTPGRDGSAADTTRPGERAARVTKATAAAPADAGAAVPGDELGDSPVADKTAAEAALRELW